MSKENYLTTEIVERPHKDNDFTAIIKVEKRSEQGKFIDFGYADAESTKSKSSKKIVDNARQEALERVNNTTVRDTTHNDNASTNTEVEAIVDTPKVFYNQTPNPSPSGTKKYRHSTTKLASEKQLNWLKNNCHWSTLETLAEGICGKGFYQMSSADADTLIKHVQNTP